MAAPDFSSMKVSQLRALCSQSGIDTTGMLEKQEFVKALEAKSPAAAAAAAAANAATTTTAAPDGDENTRVDFHEMKISTLRNLCTSMGVNTTGMFEKREFVEALQRKTGTATRVVPSPCSEPEPKSDSGTTTKQNVGAAEDSKEDKFQREVYHVETVEESSSGWEGMLSESESSNAEELPLPTPRTRERGQSPVSIAQPEALNPTTRDCRRRAVSPSPSKMPAAAEDPPSPTPHSQGDPCSDASDSSIGSNPSPKRSNSAPSLNSQACARPRSLSPKPQRKLRSATRNPSPPTSDDGCEIANGSNPLSKRSGSSPTLSSQGFTQRARTPQIRPRPNSFSPKPQQRRSPVGRNPLLPTTTSDSQNPPLSKSLHSRSKSSDQLDRPKTPARSKSAGSMSPAVKLSTIEKIRRQQQRREKQRKEDAILRAKHTKRRGKEMMDEPIYHDSAGMYDNSPLNNDSRRLRTRKTAISDNDARMNESNSARLQSRRAAISDNDALNNDSRRLQSRRTAISS